MIIYAINSGRKQYSLAKRISHKLRRLHTNISAESELNYFLYKSMTDNDQGINGT